MKRTVISLMALSLFSLGTMGCADKATTKTETTVTTPGGKTTIEQEKTIKQTGDNPPPVR